VRIVESAIEPYARTLPAAPPPAAAEPDDPEAAAAAILTLDAINFGSGWFPTLRKPPGLSGFRTVEAGLNAHGPYSAAELAAITAPQIAGTLGQDPDHELMGHFATHLRALGEHVREHGSFLAVARAGERSATALATHLARLPTWHDVSPYEGGEVPFHKRAQLAAADLARAGVAPADDLADLTLFADNLVPHVLRLDGVLELDPELVARIETGTLLRHDSIEEVEIRACAVHAVELLVASHGATTAMAVDDALWHRGGAPRYKAVPRHRARTTDY
jgi:Potential Queuosine, Q, salvage protein family